MSALIRWISIAIVTGLLAGCAGFSKQAYSPAPAVKFSKILVATPDEFPKLRVGVAGNVGLMFGPIGAIAATHDVEELSQQLDRALSSQGAGYQQQLMEKIQGNLAAAGISTEIVGVKRDGRVGLIEDYKSLAAQKQADAILDIFVTEASFGGTHPMLDPQLRPILRVRARLVSTKNFETLYADDIFFGFSNPFMSAQEIKSPKEYYYSNLQAVLTNKAQAAEGMRVAATEVARFLTNQFTQPSGVVAQK